MLVPSSRTFINVLAGAFGLGSMFLVYLSLAYPNWWSSSIFLLTAALAAGLGIRGWHTRHIPLRVERGGRVSYGERESTAPA